uniref:Uncharacterized protein n=1 Tax=Streptomyces avermitilis TaxID=33903 RepID=A0A499VAC4_STRAX|nr:hypothetical protein SAVMC3_24490 [Streptomyces avermitilis]
MAVGVLQVDALVARLEGDEEMSAGSEHPMELREDRRQFRLRGVDERIPGEGSGE